MPRKVRVAAAVEVAGEGPVPALALEVAAQAECPAAEARVLVGLARVVAARALAVTLPVCGRAAGEAVVRAAVWERVMPWAGLAQAAGGLVRAVVALLAQVVRERGLESGEVLEAEVLEAAVLEAAALEAEVPALVALGLAALGAGVLVGAVRV